MKTSRSSRFLRPCLTLLAGTALVAGSVQGCSPFQSEEHSTFLRIHNATSWEMTDVEVFTTPRLRAETLPAGERTEYREVETAYSIATVRADIQGESHLLQVIDFVGETPLGRGRFTYRLELLDEPGTQLLLSLVRDD